MAFTEAQLLKLLIQAGPASAYKVAFSGGLDSTVLLHGASRVRSELEAPLAAIHIDHQLHEASGDWAKHCKEVCSAWGIPFEQHAVDVKDRDRLGLEAAARQARYQMLASRLRSGEMLLLAQHQDDQAETLLLQLLRGAGPAGLAAMAVKAPLGAGRLYRPLLGFRRAELADYGQRHGLHWLDDPSNRDLVLDRNYLREMVIPRIQQRWPGFSKSLARSAGHCAAATEILTEIADQDLQVCLGEQSNRLRLSVLRDFPRVRQAELLRGWIRSNELPLPGTVQINQILNEVLPARRDALPLVAWRGAEIRRYRDELWLSPPLAGHDSRWMAEWKDAGQSLTLPSDLGSLHMVAAASGIPAKLWHRADRRVGFRREGLACRPLGRTGTRSLKKLFQQYEVPPWLRDRVPLLFLDGQLASVANFCSCGSWDTDTDDYVRLVWRQGRDDFE